VCLQLLQYSVPGPWICTEFAVSAGTIAETGRAQKQYSMDEEDKQDEGKS
jgi:hypothetical protein